MDWFWKGHWFSSGIHPSGRTEVKEVEVEKGEVQVGRRLDWTAAAGEKGTEDGCRLKPW